MSIIDDEGLDPNLYVILKTEGSNVWVGFLKIDDTFESWVRSEFPQIIGTQEWIQCRLYNKVWRSDKYALKFYTERDRYDSDLKFHRKYEGSLAPHIYATYENDKTKQYAICKEYIVGDLISDSNDIYVLEKYHALIDNLRQHYEQIDTEYNFVYCQDGSLKCFDFDGWVHKEVQ